jgi:hypothetical protein
MKSRFWIEGALEIVFDSDRLSPREWERLAELGAFLSAARSGADLPPEMRFYQGSAEHLAGLDAGGSGAGQTLTPVDSLRRLAIDADRNVGRILLGE